MLIQKFGKKKRGSMPRANQEAVSGVRGTPNYQRTGP
jgi:hypothetical protein